MTIGRFPKSRQFSLKPNFAEFGQIAKVQHMIKKKQLLVEEGDEGRTAAELFYSLAA
jgi:hypothetical protein